MTQAKNILLVPLGLVVMAGVLLIVVLLRAQLSLAPAPTAHQAGWSAPAAAAQAQVNTTSSSNSAQAITPIGTGAPLSAPKPASQQPAAESMPTPGTGHCPVQPRGGLPCVMP
jgi:hypothetical protein